MTFADPHPPRETGRDVRCDEDSVEKPVGDGQSRPGPKGEQAAERTLAELYRGRLGALGCPFSSERRVGG